MHIGLCPGPCVGAISREEYRRTVDRALLFLQGKRGEVLDSLTEEMKQAAQRLDFERAAVLRDQVEAVELVTIRHDGVTALRGDQDILAVAQHEDTALVDVFSVRDAKASRRQTFPIEGAPDCRPLRCCGASSWATTPRLPICRLDCCCNTRSRRPASSGAGCRSGGARR
jgi:excinuclease UvrABC nuclease subunit